eukprot:SAG22_NODE_4500_length_1250_cov_1.026933_1_plen_284_part_10
MPGTNRCGQIYAACAPTDQVKVVGAVFDSELQLPSSVPVFELEQQNRPQPEPARRTAMKKTIKSVKGTKESEFGQDLGGAGVFGSADMVFESPVHEKKVDMMKSTASLGRSGKDSMKTPLSVDFEDSAGGASGDSNGNVNLGTLKSSANSDKLAALKSADVRRGARKANFNAQMLTSHDVRTGAVFQEHAASFTLYSTITNERIRERIKDLIKGMHEHASEQQHLMTDQMSYEDILGQGILYPGEFLIDGLEPMRLKTLDMHYTAQELMEMSNETRFGIRLYLT